LRLHWIATAHEPEPLRSTALNRAPVLPIVRGALPPAPRRVAPDARNEFIQDLVA